MAQSAEKDLVSQLMASNEEYRSLAEQHSSFDRRLEELADRRFPSQEEQIEEARLKKKKLQIKDRMHGMLREIQQQAS